MKSAEEILRAHSSVCPKFPDPTCGDGCMCNADLVAIRAAQIDAAEWMREEAAKLMQGVADAADKRIIDEGYSSSTPDRVYDQSAYFAQAAVAIRSIKLPEETI